MRFPTRKIARALSENFFLADLSGFVRMYFFRSAHSLPPEGLELGRRANEKVECVVILESDMKDDDIEGFKQTYTQLIKEHGGEVIKIEDWEPKKLAYLVKRRKRPVRDVRLRWNPRHNQ